MPELPPQGQDHGLTEIKSLVLAVFVYLLITMIWMGMSPNMGRHCFPPAQFTDPANTPSADTLLLNETVCDTQLRQNQQCNGTKGWSVDLAELALDACLILPRWASRFVPMNVPFLSDGLPSLLGGIVIFILWFILAWYTAVRHEDPWERAYEKPEVLLVCLFFILALPFVFIVLCLLPAMEAVGWVDVDKQILYCFPLDVFPRLTGSIGITYGTLPCTLYVLHTLVRVAKRHPLPKLNDPYDWGFFDIQWRRIHAWRTLRVLEFVMGCKSVLVMFEKHERVIASMSVIVQLYALVALIRTLVDLEAMEFTWETTQLEFQTLEKLRLAWAAPQLLLSSTSILVFQIDHLRNQYILFSLITSLISVIELGMALGRREDGQAGARDYDYQQELLQA